MSTDFDEKLEKAALDACVVAGNDGEPAQDQWAYDRFKAGAKWAWNILSSSFDKRRKEDSKEYLNAMKVLTYERQLLQVLAMDYVDHFQIVDCQSCDPEVGFSCQDCCQWQRTSDALAKLGVRK